MGTADQQNTESRKKLGCEGVLEVIYSKSLLKAGLTSKLEQIAQVLAHLVM